MEKKHKLGLHHDVLGKLATKFQSYHNVSILVEKFKNFLQAPETALAAAEKNKGDS